MQRVERLVRMDVRTTDIHYPLKNKNEIVIEIINIKSKRKRVQRNIPKRVWGFGMLWKSEIYSFSAVKDDHPAL